MEIKLHSNIILILTRIVGLKLKLGWLRVDYPAKSISFNDYPLFSRIGRLETKVEF